MLHGGARTAGIYHGGLTLGKGRENLRHEGGSGGGQDRDVPRRKEYTRRSGWRDRGQSGTLEVQHLDQGELKHSQQVLVGGGRGGRGLGRPELRPEVEGKESVK